MLCRSDTIFGVEPLSDANNPAIAGFFIAESTMNQGDDRGKSPNVTGTQPKRRKERNFQQPKKAEQGHAGQGSTKSRKPSPKKVTARRTSKSINKFDALSFG
jgi:hypothetical protein